MAIIIIIIIITTTMTIIIGCVVMIISPKNPILHHPHIDAIPRKFQLFLRILKISPFSSDVFGRGLSILVFFGHFLPRTF